MLNACPTFSFSFLRTDRNKAQPALQPDLLLVGTRARKCKKASAQLWTYAPLEGFYDSVIETDAMNRVKMDAQQ